MKSSKIRELPADPLAYSNMSKPYPCFRLRTPSDFNLQQFLVRYIVRTPDLEQRESVSVKQLALARCGIYVNENHSEAILERQHWFLQAVEKLRRAKQLNKEMLYSVYLSLTAPELDPEDHPPLVNHAPLLDNLFSVLNNCQISNIDRAYLAYCQLLLIQPFEQHNELIARVLWQALIPQELEILSPTLYQQSGNQAAHEQMLEQYREGGINLDHPAFLNRSKRWGEELKLKFQHCLDRTEQKLHSRLQAWSLEPQQIQLLTHLWRNPVFPLGQYPDCDDFSRGQIQREISQLLDAGVLLSTTTSPSRLKRVYYCPAILDCFQQMEYLLLEQAASAPLQQQVG